MCQGPYKGLKIQISENIKIRKEFFTSTPNLCYNYRVLNYGSFSSTEVDSSKSLSRIIGAIAVEFLSEEILKGGVLEPIDNNDKLNAGIKNRKNNPKEFISQ